MVIQIDDPPHVSFVIAIYVKIASIIVVNEYIPTEGYLKRTGMEAIYSLWWVKRTAEKVKRRRPEYLQLPKKGP
jgi:hypothetical protein